MASDKARRARWDAYYANPMRRFWDRVDTTGGADACWPWKGPTKRRGYGFVMHHRRAVGAHRLALAGSHEALPPQSVLACHKCDNPPCCNPSHLFWGSSRDNSEDRDAKGRTNGAPLKFDRGQLMRLRETGLTYSQLAAIFSVNQGSIARALKRESAILKAKKAGGGV